MSASRRFALQRARDDADRGAPSPRIGPNAVIQLGYALLAQEGRARTEAIYAAAGLSPWLDAPPAEMVDETAAVALHRAARAALPAAAADAVLIEAGRRTGDYLLANRIPKLAQAVLKPLPGPIAARILAAAIARHAWTFAGSGAFRSARAGRPSVFTITSGPFADAAPGATAPACVYFAAIFERLFEVLVDRRARVRETACACTGSGDTCRFEAQW